MAKSNMNQDILKVLLSEEQIRQRIQEMGDELFDRFEDKDPMFVGVLNGCFVFMADLVRATQLKSEVEFIIFNLHYCMMQIRIKWLTYRFYSFNTL